jgi:predicted transglutaminase-like cysteine proteinase
MSECPHGLFDVCCTNYERCTLGAPKKEWVGLTKEERRDIFDLCERDDRGYVAAMVEAKLKEKNT